MATTTTRGAVVLAFRDKLRIEFDLAFRNSMIHISGAFDRLPTRLWHDVRRDPTRNDRPWSRLLRVVDEACRAGANEEQLLELPALLTAYIYARLETRELTPASGVVAVPDRQRSAA